MSGSRLRRDDPGDRGGDAGAKILVAGEHPRAGQRHVLPQIRFAALIVDEPYELRSDGSLAALRAKAQVDLVEAPAPGRDGERRDEALRQAREVDDGVELSRAGALAALLVEIVDDDEVEVRARGELARAEAAEPEDGDARARHLAVLGRKDPPHLVEGGADRRLRDRGIGAPGLGRRQDVGQKPRAGDEAHLARRVAQMVEKILDSRAWRR